MNNLVDKIPTLFVRYEDLVGDPRSCLTDVIKFVFELDSLMGTIVEKRIEEVSSAFVNSSANFCDSAGSFSEKQKLEMSGEVLADYISFFGYGQSSSETILSTQVSAPANNNESVDLNNAQKLLEHHAS